MLAGRADDLIESCGGAFEVSADGKRIFSKLETGRFPEYREIPDLIVQKL